MVTWSVLEIRNPHFYARPSQARAVQKRSGFVFPSTDRVTWLVNRYYQIMLAFINVIRSLTGRAIKISRLAKLMFEKLIAFGTMYI